MWLCHTVNRVRTPLSPVLALTLGLAACTPATAPTLTPTARAPIPSPAAKVFTPDPARTCQWDVAATTPPLMTAGEGWRMAVAFTDGYPADVASTRDGQVWVAGSRQKGCTGTDQDSTGAVWRYDGRAWGTVPAPDCAAELDRVLTTREGAVWVFGTRHASDDRCVARWDGGGWIEENGLKGERDVMAASGTDGLWLRKGSALVRWTARSTRGYALGMTPELVGVRGSDEAWAAGFRRREREDADDYTAAENVPYFARWNGRAWHSIPSPRLDLPQDARRSSVQLRDLFAARPAGLWAMGRVSSDIQAPGCVVDKGTPSCAMGRLLILHWNGTAWSQQLGKLLDWRTGYRMVPDGSGGLWLPETDGNELTHLTRGRLIPVKLPGGLEHLIAVTTQPDSTRTWLLGWTGSPAQWVLWSTG
ncbi:hypothetical protein GCM10010486_68410 [Nonomuraea roseoviolacea subsp. carminata]